MIPARFLFEYSGPRSDMSRAAVALPTDQRQGFFFPTGRFVEEIWSCRNCHVAKDVDG